MPDAPNIYVTYCPADARLASALLAVFESAFPSPTKIRSTGQMSSARAAHIDVARCEVHIAIMTTRSLQSVNFLLELGARWGKKTIPACVPDGKAEKVEALKGPTQGQTRCDLENTNSVHMLVKTVSSEISGRFIKMPRHRSNVEEVSAIASGYHHSKPTPLMFPEGVHHLSADQIVSSANSFLNGKMPSRDGFVPEAVVGINSGGTFAASVFSERRPNIRIGSIWIRDELLDPDRSFLPSMADISAPKVLLIDSMLMTGRSATAAYRYVRNRWKEAEIRLLVTLIYGGWDRRSISFPDRHFWPAFFELQGERLENDNQKLPFYAAYYTKRSEKISEPGN